MSNALRAERRLPISLLLLLLVLKLCACSTDESHLELGVDSCPECRLVEPEQHRARAPPMEELGADMCPECRFSGHEDRRNTMDEQLDRLERLVSKLEDSLRASRCTTVNDGNPRNPAERSDIAPQGGEQLHSNHGKGPGVGTPPSGTPASKGRTRTVARYKPAWSEYFQFLSAFRVDASVSCVHILPHQDEDGLSKYVVVGDDAGRLYVFSVHGDLMVEHEETRTRSPVTVMVSMVLRRNETLLVTGHANGDVVAYRLWETVNNSGSTMEEWTSLNLEDGPSFAVTTLEARVVPVTNLEMYRVGRMRYLVVAYSDGTVQVFREDGTVYGTVTTSAVPLAFLRTSNSQRLLFLTSQGTSSLDLRTMTIKNSPCEGVNSTMVAFTMDAGGRSKAYGVTESGELVYVVLSGDTLHFGCHARAKRKLELDGTVALHGLKGYLLIATHRTVTVYNTSMSTMMSSNNVRAAGMFTTSMDEILTTFMDTLRTARNGNGKQRQPLLACDRDRVVVVGFEDGYVGIFKSNLPVQSMVRVGLKFPGGTPAFVTITLMAMVWYYFFTRRRDVHQRHGGEQAAAVTAAAAATAGPSTGTSLASFGSSSGVGRSISGSPKFEKVRSVVGASEGILEEPSRRFGSPSRATVGGLAAASAAGGGYGALKYRNTAVEHYGSSSIRSTSSQ